MAQEGASVMIGDYNLEQANAVAEKINKNGGTAHAAFLNVLEKESIKN